VNTALAAEFDLDLHQQYRIVGSVGLPWVFLNEAEAARAGVDFTDAVQTTARLLRQMDGVAGAYPCRSLDQIASIEDEELRGRIERNFWPGRSGQIYLHVKYGWTSHDICCTHGSAHPYDTHVPLIFFGQAFAPGEYDQMVSPCDLSVTLGRILEIPAMSDADGHVLETCLK